MPSYILHPGDTGLYVVHIIIICSQHSADPAAVCAGQDHLNGCGSLKNQTEPRREQKLLRQANRMYWTGRAFERMKKDLAKKLVHFCLGGFMRGTYSNLHDQRKPYTGSTVQAHSLLLLPLIFQHQVGMVCQLSRSFHTIGNN